MCSSDLKPRLPGEVFDDREDDVALFFLQEARIQIDDLEKGPRNMQTERKRGWSFAGAELMRKEPRSVGKGKFHFVAVAETGGGWEDFVYGDMAQSSDVGQAFRYERLLVCQLLFIRQMLPLTAAAIPAVWAGRDDTVAGRPDQPHEAGLRPILLFLDDLRLQDIAGDGMLDEYDAALEVADPATSESGLDDFDPDVLAFA